MIGQFNLEPITYSAGREAEDAVGSRTKHIDLRRELCHSGISGSGSAVEVVGGGLVSTVIHGLLSARSSAPLIRSMAA
jgi:hypothetical protein